MEGAGPPPVDPPATATGGEARYDAAFVAGFPRKARRLGGVILPRETGAIAQILVNLATALIAARGRPASVALAVSALTAFMSHEPFMILANHRGPRSRHENGKRAARQLLVTALLALGSGLLGLALAPAGTRWSTLVPAVPALLLAPLVLGRLEKTTEGELLAALALAGFAFPIAVTGGVPFPRAAVIAGVLALVQAVATLAVRVITGTAHGAMTRARFLAPLALAAVAVAAAVALAARGVLPARVPWSLAPVLAFSTYITLLPPHLRHIRKVGWTLAACSLATMALLLTG